MGGTSVVSGKLISSYTDEGIKQAIDALPIDKDMKEILKYCISNTAAYAELCRSMKKSPNDPKVLAAFLASKGKSLTSVAAGLAPGDAIAIADAVFKLLADLGENLRIARMGPFGALYGFGLVLIDSANVGFQIPYFQRKYYELFLKTSSVH